MTRIKSTVITCICSIASLSSLSDGIIQFVAMLATLVFTIIFLISLGCLGGLSVDYPGTFIVIFICCYGNVCDQPLQHECVVSGLSRYFNLFTDGFISCKLQTDCVKSFLSFELSNIKFDEKRRITLHLKYTWMKELVLFVCCYLWQTEKEPVWKLFERAGQKKERVQLILWPHGNISNLCLSWLPNSS